MEQNREEGVALREKKFKKPLNLKVILFFKLILVIDMIFRALSQSALTKSGFLSLLMGAVPFSF